MNIKKMIIDCIVPVSGGKDSLLSNTRNMQKI